MLNAIDVLNEEEWPKEAEQMYERYEVLGKGSFGLVWMCRRRSKQKDEFDDEFVALKNIEIKEEKGKDEKRKKEDEKRETEYGGRRMNN